MSLRRKAGVALIGATTGVAFGGMSGLLISTIDHTAHDPDNVSPAAAHKEEKDAEAYKAEIEQKMVRIQQKAGEACVSAMTPYRGPNGILQGTETDTVVADLLGDPNKPCGTTPTQVREHVVGMQFVDGDLNDAQHWVKSAHASVIDSKDYSPPLAFDTAIYYGMAVGAVVGLGINLISDRNYQPVPALEQSSIA